MWMPATDAPDGVVVMTRIDDAAGVRNEQAMYRHGRLWWVPDGSMYVYYRPTHYRLLTEDEKERERDEIRRDSAAHAKAAERIA